MHDSVANVEKHRLRLRAQRALLHVENANRPDRNAVAKHERSACIEARAVIFEHRMLAKAIVRLRSGNHGDAGMRDRDAAGRVLARYVRPHAGKPKEPAT